MFAHNEQTHSEQLLSKRQLKHPTQFMFIDSSNGGVNAKPDKIVRSFVMKSARNKKPWSTRPKSPRTQVSEDKTNKRRSSSRKHKVNKHDLTLETLPGMEAIELSTSIDARLLASPDSSRSNSISSFSSLKGACESLTSRYTSSCTENDDAFRCVRIQQALSEHSVSFGTKALSSFDCLVVRLDAKAECLLYQCRWFIIAALGSTLISDAVVEAAAPRLIPVDPYRSSEADALKWIRACIQSSTGAPFIYAALTSSLRAAQVNLEAYKWRAMSEVNGLLSNPRTSTNDTTIAAVLMLLAIEEADLADPKRKGDERKCSMSVNEAHRNGLRTMIQQRGGLASLSGNRCLQVCLLM
jgi:hypothetical protein